MFHSLGVTIRRVRFETWLLLTLLTGLLLVTAVVVGVWLFLVIQVAGKGKPAFAAQSTAPQVVVHKESRELYGVSWHTDLDHAMAAAQEGPAKPVFVFRVLGDFAGFM